MTLIGPASRHWQGCVPLRRFLGKVFSVVHLGGWHNVLTVVSGAGSLGPRQLSAEAHSQLLEVNTSPLLHLFSALLPFSRAVSSLSHG